MLSHKHCQICNPKEGTNPPTTITIDKTSSKNPLNNPTITQGITAGINPISLMGSSPNLLSPYSNHSHLCTTN